MPRLFFALWPDTAVRDELYRAAQAAHDGSGGRLMRRDNLHQTLVFVGSVAAERIAGLEAAAAAIMVPAFKLAWGTDRGPGATTASSGPRRVQCRRR